MRVVCKESGNYRVLAQDGFEKAIQIINGEFVTPRHYVYTSILMKQGDIFRVKPCKEELLRDGIRWAYKINKDMCGDGWDIKEYYITEEQYADIFRPFVTKHLQIKLFYKVEDLNEWLKNVPPEAVKDIKPDVYAGEPCHMVTYEERGDE